MPLIIQIMKNDDLDDDRLPDEIDCALSAAANVHPAILRDIMNSMRIINIITCISTISCIQDMYKQVEDGVR